MERGKSSLLDSFLRGIMLEGTVVTNKTALAAKQAKKVITGYFALADVEVGGNRPWDITIHNEAFYDKVFLKGSLGLGEAYMDGWWDSSDVDQFIYQLLSSHLENYAALPISAVWTYFKSYLLNLQSKLGSKKVIDQHYQLGNDLYQEMLDPLMVYSCGYWNKAHSLNEAQCAKFDLICRKLKLERGMKVLDIGCGWGGFEKFAAENYGVSVLGVTLSENQASYGQQLCTGLPVEIQLKDYRELKGSFDRIVSIGMFEHVGRKNYQNFMKIAKSCLKPDGLFLLHTIGRNTSGSLTDPWIHKYIFPNSLLPSVTQIGSAIENHFVMEDWHNFGTDYDKTLLAWFSKFNASWPKLKDKYDMRFYRMWKYYLLSCAGAFRSRKIQLWQIVLSKHGILGGYQSVR